MSERHACRVVKQPRGTQRYRPTQRDDEDTLTLAIVTLASQYGRYGYRRITALLRRAGWQVGKDRVERIWRREGLKVPQKQKPRGRLWLNDGSCVRLRPQARRSRTGITQERFMDPTISHRSQSRAMLQAPSLKAASEGWMSENQFLLAEGEKYFFLTSSFIELPHTPDGGEILTKLVALN